MTASTARHSACVVCVDVSCWIATHNTNLPYSICTAAPAEWSCSLANPRNPYCPAKVRGDIRCNDEYCPPHAGCTDSSCNAVKGNIKADKIIALDAYVVKGDECVLDMLSAPECCNLCKATDGCNAWSYWWASIQQQQQQYQ
jgi:hypothetical protein